MPFTVADLNNETQLRRKLPQQLECHGEGQVGAQRQRRLQARVLPRDLRQAGAAPRTGRVSFTHTAGN